MDNRAAFFDAVRRDDVATVWRLLAEDPTLARSRWSGRAGDGKMRSLGPTPFNQHTWVAVPADAAQDDPRFTSTPLIYSRNDEIVLLLVEAGADVNAKGTSGEIEMPDWFFTPLWRAAHDNRLASVRLLVERGADVSFANPDGSNQALKTAAENDAQNTWEFLLTHGAKPDLITAAMLGLPDAVETILAKDASIIDVRDSHGRTALDAATLLDSFRRSRRGLHDGHRRAAKVLVKYGATIELEHAASLGMLDRIKLMVAKDLQILQRPKVMQALLGGTATKESPLQAAARGGHKQVVEFLAAHGAVERPQVFIR
jgi:ankyrin repeat protein